MDFATSYFGKPLTQLTYADIQLYFDEERQETETVEFKSYHDRTTFDAGLQGVIRGIAAFLNSSGGILIWGAPKGSKVTGKSEDVFVGSLCPIKELVEKDRLINKISSAITPLPMGISVQILSNGNNHLYVFEIQQGIYRPHQYDGRYFVRLDGQTKPAPHYIVDALIKQISYPNVCGVIKFEKMNFDRNGTYQLPITLGIFNFSELQNEEAVSFRLLCVGGYFSKGRQQQYNTQKPQYNMNGHQAIYENFAHVLHFGTPHIGQDVIVITEETLAENKGFVELALSFGGKKSPAKSTTYKLDFTGNVPLDHPQRLIVESEENVLFSALRQRTMNAEETLRYFKNL